MCTWADRLVLLNWTGSRAKRRGTPCTGYTWTSIRPKAASPTLNVWEKGDKWHQLMCRRDEGSPHAYGCTRVIYKQHESPGLSTGQINPPCKKSYMLPYFQIFPGCQRQISGWPTATCLGNTMCYSVSWRMDYLLLLSFVALQSTLKCSEGARHLIYPVHMC